MAHPTRKTTSLPTAMLKPATHVNLLLTAIVLIYLAGASAITGGALLETFWRSYTDPIVIVVFLVLASWIFLSLYLVRVFLTVPAGHQMASVIHDLKTGVHWRERLIVGAPPLILFVLMGGIFTSFKVAIPEIHPFSWDTDFERWDRLLHGGVAPWELLQKAVGHPPITKVIDTVYNMWSIVGYSVLLGQIFTLKNPQVRAQFLLSIFLCFILLGSVFAVLLSSAGPCYFHLVAPGESPYGQLMAYLKEYNLGTFNFQQILWDSKTGAGAGISAMPSLHVSIATLIALLGWRGSWGARIPALLFLGSIMVGSVHLGWHYAIDGYFSIICTTLIWFGCGYMARQFYSVETEAAISVAGDRETATFGLARSRST